MTQRSGVWTGTGTIIGGAGLVALGIVELVGRVHLGSTGLAGAGLALFALAYIEAGSHRSFLGGDAMGGMTLLALALVLLGGAVAMEAGEGLGRLVLLTFAALALVGGALLLVIGDTSAGLLLLALATLPLALGVAGRGGHTGWVGAALIAAGAAELTFGTLGLLILRASLRERS